jgi:hypothetical protein
MSWYPDPNQPQGQAPGEPNPYDPAQNPNQPQGQVPSGPNPYGQSAEYIPQSQSPYGQPSEYIPSSPNPYGQPVGYMPPPQNPYEQPAGYGFAPPQAMPRPLGQAIRELPRQYLKVLTKPSAQTFAEEQGKADWGIIWVQLLFIGLIGTIIGIISAVLHLVATTMLTNGNAALSTVYSLTTSSPSVASLVSVIAGFFIVVGIQYLLAKAFKGNGDFKQQGYSYLLFYVPLMLVSDVLGLVPILGLVVGFALGIYQIVLNVFSIMAAQRLSGGKATGVVLIPLAVLFLLIVLCAVAAVAIFAAAFSHSGTVTP